MAAPGALVAVWEGGELVVGVVAGEEKRRVRLVVEGGKEIRVAPSRIGWIVEHSGDVPGSTPEDRRESGRRSALANERIRTRAESIDVPLLWEIVVEENGPQHVRRECSTGELAELALGSRDGEASVVLVRALRADGTRFVRKGDGWEPRTPEKVEELLRERQRVAERENQTRELFAALRGAVRGGSFRPAGTEYEQRYLDALGDLAIHRESVGDTSRTLALEALKASGQRYDQPPEGAFRLLRRIGKFDHDDVNLQVLHLGLAREFPETVLKQAARAAAEGFRRDGREDLTGLEAVSIDGPHTREIDDALSLERIDENRFRLGVHIAAPATLVRRDDPVDREALARALTHYHPDLTLTMLPPVLAEDAASLVPDQARPALSFVVELDGRGDVVGSRITRSVIRSAGRLDYDRADRAIEQGDGAFAGLLAEMAGLARLREHRRAEAGALCLHGAEVDLHVDAHGEITLERIDSESASRRLVSEAMILAGEVAATFCCRERLATVYRRQDAPDIPPHAVPFRASDPVTVRSVRRRLARAETSLEPGRHHGLGLEPYAQVTSPLRRFQDLAAQRQIAAHLAGEVPPYDAAAMQRIAATTEQAELHARRAERAANEYWLLRYLERFVDREVQAVVVETEPRPVVHLLDTLREQPMPSLAGVERGERLDLRVERVNPRAGLLVLRRTG